VLRNAGKAAGALALLLDIGKGAAATALAGRLARARPPCPRGGGGDGDRPHVPGVAPLRGRQGRRHRARGVRPARAEGGGRGPHVFAVVAAATRYVSLGSIGAGLVLAALVLAARGPDPVALAAALTAALVVLRHRSNLRRILGGTERRVGPPKE